MDKLEHSPLDSPNVEEYYQAQSFHNRVWNPWSPCQSLEKTGAHEPMPYATWDVRQHFKHVLAIVKQHPERRNEIFELQSRLIALEHRVNLLESQPESVTVFVSTFAPKPFVVLRNIPLLVQSMFVDDESGDCEYVASFVEGGVGSTGDTPEEAVRNAKDRLITKFEVLDKTPRERLSHRLAVQFDVLKSVMARRGNAAP
jgi:predicted RNase H-like HicB family nuclease